MSRHRNSLQKSLYPVVICPWLCSSDPEVGGSSGIPNRGAAHAADVNRIAIITTINRIAIITTINRIAIITTINRIAIITTIDRIAIITTIDRIAIIPHVGSRFPLLRSSRPVGPNAGGCGIP